MGSNDPGLDELKAIINDVSRALGYLGNRATGRSQSAEVPNNTSGQICEIAQYLDGKFHFWICDSVVGSALIERGVDVAFYAASRNPNLRLLSSLRPFVSDLAQVGLSAQYRGRTFGDVVGDTSLSRYSDFQFTRWIPEVKSLAAATVALALRGHYLD